MNTVFLIGNGFDIALGLKTSYRDFYQYYLQQPSNDPAIAALKQTIQKHYNDWADFEKEFGEYTARFSSLDEFDKVYDDVLSHIQTYINTEDEKFKKVLEKNYTTDNFWSSLIFPDDFIREKRKLSALFVNQVHTDIINFNYTTTINEFLKNIVTGKKSIGPVSRPTVLGAHYHIHGMLGHPILFGVNDVSQIGYNAKQSDSLIDSELVKPMFNQKLGYETDEICTNIIKEANLICIFGMSIGDTDKYWWEQIGKSLKEESHYVILFYWGDEKFTPVQERLKIRKEGEIKKMFMKKAELPEDMEYLANKIFVGYNTNIFQNIIKTK